MGTILSESSEAADEDQAFRSLTVALAPSSPGTRGRSGWASPSTSPNSSAPNWRDSGSI